MDIQQINIQMVNILDQWNPFGLGEGNYETEIADVVQSVHDLDDAEKLARKIRSIYEFSFEELLPFESCLKVAHDLLSIKSQGSCSL